MKRVDRHLAALIGATLLLDAFLWLYVALHLSSLPEVLPIHYNSAGQVDRVGLREQLFILPEIGLGIPLVNGGLMVVLRSREPRLGYLLLSVSLVVELLLLGAVLQLVH